MTKGSDLLVAALENEGVERIFGVPGEENLDVVESLHGSKIELIVTRHEQAAAFMAATYGAPDGQAGRLYEHAGTWGPEFLHGCLCVSGRHADGPHHWSEGDSHQQAGPVSDCGRGLEHDPTDQDGGPDRSAPQRSRRSCARHSGSRSTQMGKGSVSAGSNLYMGTAALSERDSIHQAIDRADLILSIGHDTVEKPAFIMGLSGPKVIHVGYEPATVEEVFFPTQKSWVMLGQAWQVSPNPGANLSA